MLRPLHLALVVSCAATLTACGEATPPGFLGACREDLGLSDADCADVEGWRLPEALPLARGNAYGDDLRAAALGREIFFDTGFATVPDVSCATCHLPELAFQDGVPVPEVIPGSPVGRNSPTLYNVAWIDGFFFWDGRADSLWSQPLFAFENDIEMATTRLAIAHRIFDVPTYRTQYEAVFGALPPLSDLGRFPANGKPGQASFDGMSEADRDAVNRIAANVGKALEAYMRRLATGPSAVDRYIDGDRSALDEQARRGLERFVESGCAICHSGPMLDDGRFHVSVGVEDRGRARGIEILLSSPFNSAGPYFDRDAGEALELPLGPTEDDEHAFRTPSMRNVVQTAPYGHAGTRTLDAILSAPGVLYEEGDEVVIEAFLRALDGTPPPVEWSTPP